MALSWLFAVVTGLKIGSSNNYFVEFLVLLIIALPYLLQHEVGGLFLFDVQRYIVTIRSFACFAVYILITSKALGLVSSVYIDRSIQDDKEQYTQDKKLYDHFINDLHLQQGEKVLFTERNFLDNLFIEYAIMPTKDVASEVYLANSKTYDYSAFTKGLNNGMVKYVVADARRKNYNRWHKQLPFMLIDDKKFKWIGDWSGYSIYQYAF